MVGGLGGCEVDWMDFCSRGGGFKTTISQDVREMCRICSCLSWVVREAMSNCWYTGEKKIKNESRSALGDFSTYTIFFH